MVDGFQLNKPRLNLNKRKKTRAQLIIKSQGRGSYARTRADKYGFPRLYMPRVKIVLGFKTGDIVKSPRGTGRISVRSNGYFHLKTNKGKTTTIKHNLCKLLQRCDGYSYQI